MAAHTYWRIYIPVEWSPAYYGEIAEIEMLSGLGGADQCSGGTATALGYMDEARSPSKAVDDDTGTRWQIGVGSGGITYWWQYQFATTVTVNVVTITPSSSPSRAPGGFQVQWSDNGSDWTTVATFTPDDVGSWSGLTQKTFDFTPPPIQTQSSAFYALGQFANGRSSQLWPLVLARPCLQGFGLGELARAQSQQPYPLQMSLLYRQPFNVLLAGQVSAPYSTAMAVIWSFPFGLRAESQMGLPWGLRAGTGTTQPYPLSVASQRAKPWAMWVGAHGVQPIHGTVNGVAALPWSIHSPVVGQLAHPYGSSTPVAADGVMPWDLLTFNPVAMQLRAVFDLVDSSPIILASTPPTLVAGGMAVALGPVDIGIAEGEFAWTGTAVIIDPSGFAALAVNTPVTLTMGGEAFSLLVVNRMVERSGPRPVMTVALASPTVALAGSGAAPITKTWASIAASAAAEEVAGEAIDWQLVDWTLPPGRLAFQDAPLMAVLQAIAGAAGGMVETLPGGGMVVRHTFPTRVPDWESASPDHVITDAFHILSSQESLLATEQPVDRVTIRDFSPAGSGFPLEVDTRDGGPNGGSSSFSPGTPAHLMAHLGAEMSLTAVTASDGTIWQTGPQTWQQQVAVAFADSDRATLPRHAVSIDGVTWLGTDLGDVTLSPDGITVVADSPGVAVAMITFTSRAQGLALSVGAESGEEYPVQVVATASVDESPTAGDVVCIRGDGLHPAEDRVEPLAYGVEPKRELGRAIIDGAEPMVEVNITAIHLPGVMPGHLVEVHDALQGESYMAKLVGVRHMAAGPRIETELQLVKRYG